MVSQEALRGNWNSIVGMVKEKFGQITGDELSKVEGNMEQVVGLIQRKTGQTKQQVEAFLSECCDNAGSYVSSATEAAGKAASKASRFVVEGYDKVAEGAERGYDYARSTVERRPVESVAFVAGFSLLAGVLIGLALGNRR